jgi:hypothetical protein
MFRETKVAGNGLGTRFENVMEIAAATPPVRQSNRCRPGQLLPGIDGRSAWVRRCRDLIAAHLSDLGGEANTSAAERNIVRRAAVLTTELERMERQFALDEQASAPELDAYQRCANSLRRLLEAVGLQRRARDVGPTLADILAEDANA